MGKLFFRGFIAFLLIAAIASVCGYVWLRRYISSKEFHGLIVAQAESYLGAKTSLSPLRWDGFRVNVEEFEAKGEGQTKSVGLQGIKTGIDAGGVARGVWSVLPSRVTNLSLTLDATAQALPTPPPQLVEEPTPPQPVKKAWYDRWVPKRIETDALVISNSDLRVILAEGEARLNGTRWELEPTKGFDNCKLSGNGGTLKLPYAWAPAMKLDHLRFTYHDGFLYLTDATLSAYENGHVRLAGEFDPASKFYALEGAMRDILCSEVLPPDWKQRLSGVVESTFSVQSRQSTAVVKGHVKIHQGILTALPVLDKLAAYSQSLRFRTLSLHDAEADYEITDQGVTLSNVILGSEGLARMEGKIRFLNNKVDRTCALDGDFRVGLAPGTLATIPGAEEDVFVQGERGLLWAPMHISGTMDKPEEDLSSRLMAAAGARMFEVIPATGLKVLKYTQQVVDEHGQETMEKVVGKTTEVVDQTIKTSTDVIGGVSNTVGGVLEIFGGGRKDPVKNPAGQEVPSPPIPTPQVPKPPLPIPPVPKP